MLCLSACQQKISIGYNFNGSCQFFAFHSFHFPWSSGGRDIKTYYMIFEKRRYRFWKWFVSCRIKALKTYVEESLKNVTSFEMNMQKNKKYIKKHKYTTFFFSKIKKHLKPLKTWKKTENVLNKFPRVFRDFNRLAYLNFEAANFRWM